MSDSFKIHSICLTKNEEDVVADCLTEAAKWSDYIYVYDGQSTDRTWEIVKGLNHPRIIPWKQDGKVFQEWLRGEVFNEFRHLARPGDWWLQLNADEYYPQSPRDFLARVPMCDHVVWGIMVQYHLTQGDLQNLDFSIPFARLRPLLRHYTATHSEIRAFRHRDRLAWGQAAWPAHLGPVSRERIVFQHYPYRSPAQIQMRLDVRRDNRARGFAGWDHASQQEWREKIVADDKCLIDDGSGRFVIDEEAMPNHLDSTSRRLLKCLMHGLQIWP